MLSIIFRGDNFISTSFKIKMLTVITKIRSVLKFVYNVIRQSVQDT